MRKVTMMRRLLLVRLPRWTSRHHEDNNDNADEDDNDDRDDA